MSNFGTTTYARRHTERLNQLERLCVQHGINQPRILEIGPGGVVSFLFRMWQKGHKSQLTIVQKSARLTGRVAENGLRRLGIFPLQTSEPQEILSHFSKFSPRSLDIVDLDQKVLNSLSKRIRTFTSTVPISLIQADICTTRIEKEFDVVIAYLIIERCDDKQRAIEHIFACVAKSGIVSTTYDQIVTPKGFIEIEKGCYLRLD